MYCVCVPRGGSRRGKMVTAGETTCRAYGYSLCYFSNMLVRLQFSKQKVEEEKDAGRR